MTRPERAALTLSLCLIVTPLGCSNTDHATAELEKIKAADQAYAAAWLTNDPEQVMATITGDAVMLPSGLPAVEGAQAIREFWWPANSPRTEVTQFTLRQREIGGQGDIGFVRGAFSLGFEYDGQAYSGRGEYFSLLRRAPDGSWRISRRMWSDQPRDTTD